MTVSLERKNRSLVRTLLGIALLLALFTIVYVAYFK